MPYNPDELAIYIHWPFCKSKCPYCDFYKEVRRDVNQDEIIARYIADLSKYHKITNNRIVKSIFFGGGTPSLIEPRNIEKIINHIYKLWHVKDKAEISLEANPNTRAKTLFKDIKLSGVNRLSLGVQALNAEDLRFLGRTHNLETARTCLKEITSVFNNHSADLIYARPNQTPSQWQQELQEITSYGLRHISLYQLTIEPNTVFARKKIQPLNDDAAAEMYNFTRDFLTSSGYQHYEVSNFAQKGYQSTHNLTYWQGGDYIGIGASAHGRLKIGNRRIATVYPFKHENLSSEERAEELIIMGLRLTEGINLQDFEQICGLNFHRFVNIQKLQDLKDMELLAESATHIYPTYKGMLVLNEIISELCP
ncbi:MAG: radical SAM family heme chaperone HemW [Alphaproteobacteria bacterium]|nr:radical SAM family heme chaperone HemW [Alphaproteobacteria bacterium]